MPLNVLEVPNLCLTKAVSGKRYIFICLGEIKEASSELISYMCTVIGYQRAIGRPMKSFNSIRLIRSDLK